MAPPSNRLHARFPCDISIQVSVPAMKNKLFEGAILDIGMGGALLSIKGSVTGPILVVHVQIESVAAEIKTRIARTVGPDKKRARHYLYGVSFETNLQNEHHLRKLIDEARKSKWTQRTGTQSGELRRDYWK